MMKGRNSKMMIPRHVHEIARKIQEELEAQKEQSPKELETRNSLRKLKKLRKKLNDPAFKDATYMYVLALFQQIIETSRPLSVSALDRIYTRVEITPSLVFAITQAYENHPEMRKELDLLQEFLQDVPNVSWGVTDAFSKYKCFKLVRTEELWEKVIEGSGYDLGRNLSSYGDLQYVRIGYATSCFNSNQFSYSVKQQLIECEQYEKVKKAFQEWFLIGTIGTFYIYIPE